MKRITDLKEQVKNKKRVSVFLDGEFYCGLDIVTVMKYRLKKGDLIDEKELVNIQYNSELQACFDRALNFISATVKTKKQIKDKLKSLGYLDEIVENTLEKLINYGFVDDGDYATRYASTYKNAKGKKLIRYELIKKGVSETEIDKALLDIQSQETACLRVAEKYLKSKEINEKNLLKCYKYLISKGFDYDDAKKVISTFKNNE